MPVATNQRRIRNYSATWISCVSSFNTRDNKMSAAALLNNSTCTKRPSRFHLGRYGLTDSEACILGLKRSFSLKSQVRFFFYFFFHISRHHKVVTKIIYPGNLLLLRPALNINEYWVSETFSVRWNETSEVGYRYKNIFKNYEYRR